MRPFAAAFPSILLIEETSFLSKFKKLRKVIAVNNIPFRVEGDVRFSVKNCACLQFLRFPYGVIEAFR